MINDELLELFHMELLNSMIYFPNPEYEKDYTQLNVVDGEEGDYGIVKYMSPNKDVLLAVKTVYGGDREEIEFTKAGKEYLTELYIETLRLQIKSLPIYEE